MIPEYEVTIGIPVYRSVQYIKSSLLSALNQTFQDIEFLLVDDAGNDGSMDIVSNLQKSHPRGKNIHVLVNEINNGVSYSRNRIIDEAKGRYLYFMDSDDAIEPNTIQLLYDALTSNQVQIAYGSYEIIDGIGEKPTEVYQKDALVLKGKDELAMYAFRNNHIFHVSVCNHLLNLHFLRQSDIRFIDASYWEDMVYTTELVTIVESAVLLPDITYHYLRRPGSLSHYQNRVLLEKEEVLKNASTLIFLKDKCLDYKDKPYLPDLCYNLEMNSFYMACHILHKKDLIIPKMSLKEVRDLLRHPISLRDIALFDCKMLSNIMFAILGLLPLVLFLPTFYLIGKLKRAL